MPFRDVSPLSPLPGDPSLHLPSPLAHRPTALRLAPGREPREWVNHDLASDASSGIVAATSAAWSVRSLCPEAAPVDKERLVLGERQVRCGQVLLHVDVTGRAGEGNDAHLGRKTKDELREGTALPPGKSDDSLSSRAFAVRSEKPW